MSKYWFIPVLMIFASCSRNEKQEKSDFDATIFKNAKKDSLKYLFDGKDRNHRYFYFLQYLPVKIIDHQAVFQGDIFLESNISERSQVDTTVVERFKRFDQPEMVGITPESEKRLWPHGLVHYKISEYGETEKIKPAILQAIASWKAAGLYFEEVSDFGGNYVLFQSKKEYTINGAPIGMGNGERLIKLRPDASRGTIIHEIGHVLGLWHEHSRFDRKQYVKINENNIDPDCLVEFEMIKDQYSFYDTKYDYASIMHYDPFAFGKMGSNGKKMMTIATIPAGIPIGQRDGLSTGDLAGIKKMYHLN